MGEAVADPQLTERIEAIKQLLKLFRVERAVYITVTVVSLVVLLGVAASLYLQKDSRTGEIIALFGSSGAITYTTGRLLRMWSEAVRLVSGSAQKEE